MWRPVSTLKIPQLAKMKLQEKGFHFCEDIINSLRSDPDTIPKSVKFIIETYEVVKQINAEFEIQTAFDLYEWERQHPPLAVFHKGLDKLLNGGLSIGRITELCGGPGSGKTQMCFQLAVDVQTPSALGGSASEVLFISTDLSFRSERIKEIATATVDHCSKIRKILNFTVESIMKNIHVIQIQGAQNLMDTIMNVHNFFKGNKKVKLLIIDSFSLPLVCGFDDLLKRTKVIYDLLDALQFLAMEYKVAIVLTNQLTTTFVSPSLEKKLVPSLSEGFGHRLHQRLLLCNGNIYITKSICHKIDSAKFEITKSGIR